MKRITCGAWVRTRTVALAAISAVIAFAGYAEQAKAIPTFSRKYQTSCATCHTVFPKLNDVGESFRRNGYQFPSGEELLVKEDPVSLGSETFTDAFPDSIWPSTLPGLPPVFVRAQIRESFLTDPGTNGMKWRQDFPHELVLGGAGTFGPDISAWWELEWEPHEGNGTSVERGFMQFSNLVAWS